MRYKPAYYPGEPKHRTKKRKKNRGALPWMTAAERHALKATLKQRDGDSCGICGRPLDYDETIDHIIEQADGGTDHISNLRVTHGRCNNARGSREAGIRGNAWQVGLP